MSSLYSKTRNMLQRNPIVTGLGAAVVGYLLLNQGTEAFETALPGLLYLLPCLLMMVVCMKHMTSSKCDKNEASGAEGVTTGKGDSA